MSTLFYNNLRSKNRYIIFCSFIVTLFQDYFATEEQNKEIDKILKTNEMKAEQEKREKYNPEDMFKNTKCIKEKEKPQTALVEYKDNFFIKLKRFIMKYIYKE